MDISVGFPGGATPQLPVNDGVALASLASSWVERKVDAYTK